MSLAISQVPTPKNEPVRSYAPGSAEVKSLISTYKKMWKEKVEIPMIIDGKEVKTGEKVSLHSPQDHKPVSYTHLDVYKRQKQSFQRNLWRFFLEK